MTDEELALASQELDNVIKSVVTEFFNSNEDLIDELDTILTTSLLSVFADAAIKSLSVQLEREPTEEELREYMSQISASMQDAVVNFYNLNPGNRSYH